MSEARIFQPAKTAMQSGRAGTRKWVLEYAPEQRKEADPLMGWTGSGDMRGQLRLKFDTKEEAVAYAKKNHISYRLIEPKERRVKPKAYANNFAFNRAESWTH